MTSLCFLLTWAISASELCSLNTLRRRCFCCACTFAEDFAFRSSEPQHRHCEEHGRSLLNFHAVDGTPDWAALLRRLCDDLPSTCPLPNWLAEGHLPNPVEEKWLRMKFLPSQAHNKALDELWLERNIVRLQCQKRNKK